MGLYTLIRNNYINPINFEDDIDKIERVMHKRYYSKYSGMFDALEASSCKEKLDKYALIYIMIHIEEYGKLCSITSALEEINYIRLMGGIVKERHIFNNNGDDYFLKLDLEEGRYVFCGFDRKWVVGEVLRGHDFTPVIAHNAVVYDLYKYYKDRMNLLEIALNMLSGKTYDYDIELLERYIESNIDGKERIESKFEYCLYALSHVMLFDILGNNHDFVTDDIEYTYDETVFRMIYIDGKLYDVSDMGYIVFGKVTRVRMFCGTFYILGSRWGSSGKIILIPELGYGVNSSSFKVGKIEIVTDIGLKRRFLFDK